MNYKSSSTSQLINSTSRDLQKSLRYLSGIVNFTFKDGTSGCGDQSVSPAFPGCESSSTPSISSL